MKYDLMQTITTKGGATGKIFAFDTDGVRIGWTDEWGEYHTLLVDYENIVCK